MKIRNTFAIFIVSGFWHGASWTFIVWGFLNALYIIPSIVFNTNRNNLDIVASQAYSWGKDTAFDIFNVKAPQNTAAKIALNRKIQVVASPTHKAFRLADMHTGPTCNPRVV